MFKLFSFVHRVRPVRPAWLAVLLPVAAGLLISPVIQAAATTGPGAGFYRTITIETGQVPSPQTDFPLLVSLTADADLQRHVARADGGDILFTDSANQVRYPHEIEWYDRSSGTLAAWVRVPRLEDGTVLKMWYGIDTGTTYEDPAGVWDSGFTMVQHMRIDSLTGGVPDSTGNTNDGTFGGMGTPVQVEGISGPAVDLPGAAYIDCGDSASLDFQTDGTYTWDIWINPALFQPGGSGIIGKKHTPNVDHQGYELYCSGSGGAGGGGFSGGFQGSAGASQLRFQTTGGNSSSASACDVGVDSGAWLQIAVVYNTSAEVRVYMNGNPVTVVTQPGNTTGEFGAVLTSDDAAGAEYQDPLFLGWRRSAPAGQDKGFFVGSLDEAEISDVLRSADWIKTEYNNRRAPGEFYDISAETPESPAANGGDTAVEMVSSDGSVDLEGLIDSNGRISRDISFGTADGRAVITLAAGTLVKTADGQFPNKLILSTCSEIPDTAGAGRLIVAYQCDPALVLSENPAEVSLIYRESDISGSGSPADLTLITRAGSSGEWLPAESVGVDTLSQILSGALFNLDSFALIGPSGDTANGVGVTAEATSSRHTNWTAVGVTVILVLAALIFVFGRFVPKRVRRVFHKGKDGE